MAGHSAAKLMWEERYRIDDYLYGIEPNEFLRDNVDRIAMGRVLCLAEGEGRNATFLARTGRMVSSVELSETGVEKTLRLAAQHDVAVNAIVADLATYDLGQEQWEGIISIFAHMPPKVRTDLHRRIIAALKPGGILLLEAYAPNQIGRNTGGPTMVEMTMALSDLRDELAPLIFLHATETEREVFEGSAHSGLGAVVQVIAQKSDN